MLCCPYKRGDDTPNSALLTAENLCLSDEFVSELAYSQREVLKQWRTGFQDYPQIKRWEAEMYQIAETFHDAGVTKIS